jgi:hypothetical protein
MINATHSVCRTRAIALIALLLSLPAAWAQADEVVVAKLPVESDSCYRLTFKAQTFREKAQWLLRTIDRDGEIPHAGCYEQEWQKIVPDTTAYTHSFRTPAAAETLEIAVRYGGRQPQVSDVKLEPITPEGLLVNGDFTEGSDNYSGWSEHNNTIFVEIDGKTALKIQHNGYALTDRVPIVGGVLYEFVRGSTMPSYVLAYDSDMHLLTPNQYHRKREFRTPEAAAYLRLLYKTTFDHIPAYRTKTITEVGLSRVDNEKPPARAEVPRLPGEIILDGRCDPREEYAARELQHWIREITGKRLRLLAKPSSADNTKIFLGSAWAAKYTDDLKYLSDSDGYAVRREGKHIHVFGSHPRGTLFGVYALLEKNTEIIWPRPHPEFAAIFSKVPEVEFAESNFRSRPAFKIRELNFFGGDPNPALSQVWIGRNGGNSPLKLGKGFPYLRWRSGATIGAGGSYIGTFMGLEQEDETLYPLVNGNRLRNKWRQPCYTHSGVPKVMAGTPREILDSVPGKQIEFLISRVGDNWEVCNCPECMKPIELADGTQLASQSTNSITDRLFFSTRNYMMLNRMAEDLVKDNPGLELHTHAYIFAAEPPKVKVHPAIVPHFAAYPTKDERYPILEQKTERGAVWGRRMRQWSDEQDVKFGFFGYYYAGGFNALADTAGPDYKALAEMGGIHAHNEGYPGDTGKLNSWDVDGCEKWIIAKLQWEPTQNPAALRDQYIKRTYRDAAPQMREFYGLINDSWHDDSNPTIVNCHTAARKLFQEFVVNPGLEKRLRALLVEAHTIASDPRSQKLIERTLAKFDMFAADLSRLPVPLVPESTGQWSQYESPHWYKAHEIGDFKRIANWQPLPEDRIAKHKTKIAMMRDKEQLYFKIDAFTAHAKPGKPPSRANTFPQADRVEIVLRSGNDTFYFAVGSDGGTYLLRNWNTAVPWTSQTQVNYLAFDGKWSVLLAVPLSDLGAESGKLDLDAKFCRVVNPADPNREESTYDGRGILNNHVMLRSPLTFDE